MTLANGLFAQVLDYLYKEGLVADQQELSAKTGISETTISRILNDRVRQPSKETWLRLNAAFGNIFNPQYFRGESVIMLVADLVQEPSVQKEKTNTESGHPTMSSMFNANLAQQAESVEAFRIALASKDETIKEKNERILELKNAVAQRDERIENLKELVAQLRADLNEAKSIITASESGLAKYPFKFGAAESSEDKKQRKHI
jgi:transcriptional regulator with XRE-family HTH domain